MAADTHSFKLLFNYPLSGDSSNTTLEITKAAQSSASIKIAGGTALTSYITSDIELVYLTFNRKVYYPNEIVADVRFSNASIQSYLKCFFDAAVEITRYASSTKQETYTGFYVYNVLPLQKSGNSNLYIRFHIFSLDHQLTIKKYSRTYVGKKLCIDILSAQKFSPSNLKFPLKVAAISDGVKVNSGTYPGLDRLYYTKGGKTYERIQPYLVQYNESFYDFMVRTANRCGEYFFWENGQLTLGRNISDMEDFSNEGCSVYYKTTNINVESDTYTTNYYALDDLNRSKDLRNDISTKLDLKIKLLQYVSFGNEDRPLNPAGDSSNDYYNNEVNQDVYRTRFYKSCFDSLSHVTVGNIAKYGTSLASLLLNETNLYDFLQKFILTKVLSTTVSKADLDIANRRGNKNYVNIDTSHDKEQKIDSVLTNMFTSAETSGHLTNDSFFKNIRQKEESLTRQLITFSTTNPQKLRLGQTFKYNGKTYVIIQLKMKLGTNISNFSAIDAEAETEFKDMVSCMEIIAIPADGTTVYPPLHPAGHVRHSEAQVAFVDDYLDPQKRGRVRIKYPWQSSKDTDASPWIRVLTPSANPDSGCSFEFSKNDEVLINYESNNIERPYVAGALYNKSNHTPFERGNMNLLSKNGHGLSSDDPIDFSKFIAGISPSYKFINQFIGIDTSDWTNSLKLVGGTTLSDAYGFYKIAMSTDQRRIDISSPFGTVNIDAFQGINICAPNGDINIKGQNINIEAGNAIKITSGTNITKKQDWVKTNEGKFAALKSVLNSVGGAILDFVGPLFQPIDMDLLRKIIQVFLRPIDGTLEIKSNQYLLLEAGKGEAMAQPDRYRRDHTPDYYNTPRKFTNRVANRNDDNIALSSLIETINVYATECIENLAIRQRNVRKAKAAYTKARNACLKVRSVDQECFDAEHIIEAVDNQGDTIDYVQNDGDLHIRLFRYGSKTVTTLKTKATELANAANALLLHKDYKQELTQSTNRLVVVQADAQTTHFNILKANIPDYDKYTDQLDACDISKSQIKALGKYIKHSWFNSCLQQINNGWIDVAYQFDEAKGKDNWSTYVRKLKMGQGFVAGAIKWLTPLADIGLQWSDAFVDTFNDRNHWAAGKPGQILFSDQPSQSFYFDRNGVSHVYPNEWTHYPISPTKLRAMISDL